MTHTVVKVYIAPMKCSNGNFFYTSILNSNGDVIAPFMSKELWKAILEADKWAAFFDLVAERFLPNDYVNEEYIAASYDAARF